ncbi:MAG: TIGR02147 family protein [Bdellovibrio sp.]
MLKSSVFDFKNYKQYLTSALEARAVHQKGQRSKLAHFIGCNPAYLSQILNGNVDLSPEQAQTTNTFLGHTSAESRYFLNLVLFERAGNKELKAYYDEELKRQRQERLVLKNRVQINRSLSETDQARYYSSWYYAAIHVAVSLPHLRSREKIAEALSLPQSTVNQALEFLLQIGVLKQHGKEFRQGEVNLYLGADSNFITKHHANWRMKSIQSLDIVKDRDLHYSGVITCSHDDALKIKELLIKSVENIREIVKGSADESLFVYTLDLFELLK